LRKKGCSGNEEDETWTNSISTYTESTHHFSPASNYRSRGTRKVHHTIATALLSNVEDISDVAEAAILSKHNPRNREKAKAEIIKVNNYDELFSILFRGNTQDDHLQFGNTIISKSCASTTEELEF
jgi:hypothetical protein